MERNNQARRQRRDGSDDSGMDEEFSDPEVVEIRRQNQAVAERFLNLIAQHRHERYDMSEGRKITQVLNDVRDSLRMINKVHLRGKDYFLAKNPSSLIHHATQARHLLQNCKRAMRILDVHKANVHPDVKVLNQQGKERLDEIEVKCYNVMKASLDVSIQLADEMRVIRSETSQAPAASPEQQGKSK